MEKKILLKTICVGLFSIIYLTGCQSTSNDLFDSDFGNTEFESSDFENDKSDEQVAAEELKEQQENENNRIKFRKVIKSCDKINLVYLKYQLKAHGSELINKKSNLVKGEFIQARIKFGKRSIERFKELFEKDFLNGGSCECCMHVFAYELYKNNKHIITILPNFTGQDIDTYPGIDGYFGMTSEGLGELTLQTFDAMCHPAK